MAWRTLEREESMNTFIRTAAIAASSFLLASAPALAASVTNLSFAGGCPQSENGPECFASGQATVDNVSILVGQDMYQVTSGFSINGLIPPATDDITDFFDVSSGTWAVTDTSITHLAFKANGFFILAEVNGASGEWSTDPAHWDLTTVTCPAGICSVADRAYVAADFLNGGTEIADLSNVRAFSVVPVPAAVWLFGSALGMLGWLRRRSSAVS
jgi:hypothetical protein